MKIQQQWKTQTLSERIWSVAWHPTAPVLAAASDRSILLYIGEGGGEWTCVSTIDTDHTRSIRDVKFSRTGKRLAAASFDGTVSVWSVMDGGCDATPLAVIRGHDSEVKSLAWGVHDGLLASSSRDKTVWIHEADDDDEFACGAILAAHTQDVKCVRWSPDGTCILSTSYDDSSIIWKKCEDVGADDWVPIQTFNDHNGTVWSASFAPSGTEFVTSGIEGSLRFYRAPDPPKRVGSLMPIAPLFNTAMNMPPPPAPEGGNGTGKWRGAATVASVHKRAVYCVEWNMVDGDMVATAGADNDIRILGRVRVTPTDPEGWEVVITEPAAHRGEVNCVCWRPVLESDGSQLLASCADDGSIKIWKLL
eukprot:GHVO01041137.1.p1 GENE.GHVO01041137.1~~GHVO01041137.1.p1  ORF type:complete len:363 (-),score=98.71 GHVO01041137.1:950-2038(-)